MVLLLIFILINIAISVSVAGTPSILMPSRILPGNSVPVVIKTNITGISSGQKVIAKFSGDVMDWSNLDLMMTYTSGSEYTIYGNISSPLNVGLYTKLKWSLAILNNDNSVTIFGPSITSQIEVTCSDGIFCNGEERYIKGKCISTILPCGLNQSDLCSRYTCYENNKTCSTKPVGVNCPLCLATACKPKCLKAVCGSDGCSGTCGLCTDGLSCVNGGCYNITQQGSCSNPVPLFGANGTNVPLSGIVTTIFGNNLGGVDEVRPSCGISGVPELIYRFDVTSDINMGFEIQMLSADGNPSGLDTVLAIHLADCVTPKDGYSYCSDDATPPGDIGSRVFGLLVKGSYRLIATGYSSSQLGEFMLKIKFVPSCVPACDGKFCGTDGCGSTCGSCTGELVCNDQVGRCQSFPCTPDCKSKQCGLDGCGGSCGTCKSGKTCSLNEGKCIPSKTCNHQVPNCPSNREGQGANVYCGSDCQWHRTDEVLIDLVPNSASEVKETIVFEWRTFDSASCAIFETCVGAQGRRLLMRFGTKIHNIALAGFKPPSPDRAPELFEYSACHQHNHFEGFAVYDLFSLNGTVVAPGRKQSYCMEDSEQYLFGSRIPCGAVSTCDDQGIQEGWTDNYPNVLDCQWLDITETPPNTWYTYQVCTNQVRNFHEHTFDNNCVSFKVYIPTVPDNGNEILYSSLVLPLEP